MMFVCIRTRRIFHSCIMLFAAICIASLFIFRLSIVSLAAQTVEQRGDAGSTSIIKPIPTYFQPAMFRGDNGATRLVLALGIPHTALEFQQSMFGKGKCPLEVSIDVRRPGSNEASVSQNKQIVVWTGTLPPDKRGYYLSQEMVTVDPGVAEISVRVTTLDESRFGRRDETIHIRSFEGDSLMMSSIQPAYRIDEPGSGFSGETNAGLTVVPYPFSTFVRNYPVYAYFQIYNLRADGSGNRRYTIDYRIYEIRESVSIFSRIAGKGKEKLIVENKLTRSARAAKNEDYISFDPETLSPGSYLLTISIIDNVSGASTENSMPFVIISEPTQLLP